MNIQEFLTIASPIILFCIVLSYTTVYITGIVRGTVKPVLATWLFFLLASSLSAFTNFRETGSEGLLSNAFNNFDAISIALVFIATLFVKESRRSFTKFEKFCTGAVILIFIGWLLSGENIIAHLSVQLILLIAYFPTFVKLWNAKENTESLGAWSLDSTAGVIGLIIPLMTLDLLPIAFGLRSFLGTFTIVLLILRLKWKEKKQ